MTHNMDSRYDLKITTLYYIIWSTIFGVTLGLFGSVLSGTLSPEPITRTIILGWFVATLLVVNKLIVLRSFSVTFMLTIASFIGIFTFYLGPPNPFKPLFILAGLAFDLGTMMRTRTIRYVDICVGFVAYGIVGATVFLLTLWLVQPSFVPPVRDIIVYALALFWAIALPVAWLIWRKLRPANTPRLIERIHRQVGSQ